MKGENELKRCMAPDSVGIQRYRTKTVVLGLKGGKGEFDMDTAGKSNQFCGL